MNKPEGKNQQGTFGQGPEHGQMPPDGGAYQEAGQGAGAYPGGTPSYPWGAPQEHGGVPPYHPYYGYYGAPRPPWSGVPAGHGGPPPTEPSASASPGGTPSYPWGVPQGYGAVPSYQHYYGYYGDPRPPWSGVPAGHGGPPPTEPSASASPGSTPSYPWGVPQGYGAVPSYQHYYGYYGDPHPPWSGVPAGNGGPPPTEPPVSASPGSTPPYPWGAPQEHGVAPPPHHHYGYYGVSGSPWGGGPPGHGGLPPTAPSAGVGTQPGFAAVLGDIADKSGLGMFKEFFNWEDSEFWKGALVGAAVVLLMTNEHLRNSLIGGAAKTAEAVKSGFAGVSAPDEVSESEAEDARDEAAPQDNPKENE
jgi:hypothetical protein